MSAWTPEKSVAFREAFYDFLSHVRINSKELGGNTVLGDHIYRAQRIFLDAVFDALSEDIHDVYVLKSRQLGLSTISRALSLFWLGMHDGLQGAMVFDTAKNTANAKFEITTVLRKLPDSLKFPRIESSNRDGLILENGSQLQFMQAGVKDSKSAGGLGRSSGLNFSHSSELCSWVNAEGIKSFRQSLSETYPDRLYIWESTARGFNEWYKMWDEAEKDRDHKKTVFLGWWAKDNQIIEQGSADFSRYGTEPPNKVESARIDTVFEEYGWEVTQEQLAWYRKKIDPNQENDEDDEEDSHLTQEQPWCAEDAFQQTGSNFFQADKLTEATRSASSEAKPKTYKFWPGFDFVTCDMTSARTMREVEFRVWEEPATEACYVVAADPAFGRDERNNNSAAQVLRCYADGVDQVAEYASSTIMPHQFAWLLWTIIGYYGSSMPGCTVMFITEINGPGEEVWRQFQSTENIVRNGYLRQAARDRGIADIFNNARKYIYGRSDSMSSGSNFQFKTNGQNKVQLMEACRNFFHNGLLSVRSIDALDEMRTITRDGDSIGAEGSNRDDRTFALALGIRAWDERVRRAMVAGNRTKKAELAKINMSIEDQWNIFRASQLSSFFKEKATARLQHTQALARQGWRNGGRQPPTGRRW